MPYDSSQARKARAVTPSDTADAGARGQVRLSW